MLENFLTYLFRNKRFLISISVIENLLMKWNSTIAETINTIVIKHI